MVITLSGVTGTGKSFLKKEIQKRLKLNNQIIYTTRPIRKGEKNGVDKVFVTDEEFDRLERENQIMVTFEFLGYRYGYETKQIKSERNSIIELHYTIIYNMKKETDNVFSIYIIPKDIEIAKQKLKNRRLEKKQEMLRLTEIEEQAKEFESNQELQSQFDYILYNNYDEESIERLIEVIQEKIEKDGVVTCCKR